jgi:hypothetical protein
MYNIYIYIFVISYIHIYVIYIYYSITGVFVQSGTVPMASMFFLSQCAEDREERKPEKPSAPQVPNCDDVFIRTEASNHPSGDIT